MKNKYSSINGTTNNPNNPFACCYGCEKRYPACSDHCEEHARAAAIKAEQKEQFRKERDLNRAERTRGARNSRGM